VIFGLLLPQAVALYQSQRQDWHALKLGQYFLAEHRMLRAVRIVSLRVRL
jgi:hypothetical protein